jgi:hypothetical protein
LAGTRQNDLVTALWLMSPESSYVTDSHLVCDGGVPAKASISV